MPVSSKLTARLDDQSRRYQSVILTLPEWAEVRAALSQGAPEGWKMVPPNPTEAMLDAWIAEMNRQGIAFDDFSPPAFPVMLYRAMLAAAPAPPEGL